MRRRDVGITSFVVIWTLIFQYETLRASYLSPLLHRTLPKLALLFPPAGWIMFYRVDPTYGFAEVYGVGNTEPAKIDPHAIFETKAIGYDNIRRNVLVGVLDERLAPWFCPYLRRKFPEFQSFAVMYGQYPDVVNRPDEVHYQVAYRCE